MNQKENINIGILEDDPYYNKALYKYVQSICDRYKYAGLNVNYQVFTNPNECIQELNDGTDILLLDYYLMDNDQGERLNGEDVLKAILPYSPDCNVIVISTLNDVHKATRMIKLGAIDFIEKNLNDRSRLNRLFDQIISNKITKNES